MSKDFGTFLAQIVGREEVEKLREQARISVELLTAREEKKWSQQQLANATGIDVSTIQYIEGGIIAPSHEELEKIIGVLS